MGRAFVTHQECMCTSRGVGLHRQESRMSKSQHQRVRRRRTLRFYVMLGAFCVFQCFCASRIEIRDRRTMVFPCSSCMFTLMVNHLPSLFSSSPPPSLALDLPFPRIFKHASGSGNLWRRYLIGKVRGKRAIVKNDHVFGVFQCRQGRPL